jgi:predicted dehydrogenase
MSTANIGATVVQATRGSARTRFAAVASRDAGRARAFADRLGIAGSYGSYEELLAAEDIDAVYVALPVSMHTEWTVKALQAGKHVLCEKPFATSAADATRAFEAAVAADRYCIEGLMWRLHPQTALAQRLLAEGAIGELSTVRAALSVAVPPGDIRRDPATGGGALFDLGTYCTSAIRLFAGEPERVFAERRPDVPGPDGRPGVDLRMAATVRCPGGVLGQFDIGLDLPRRDELELIGTAGKITVPDPWICRGGSIELWRDGVAERLPTDPDGGYALTGEEADVYRIEFDTVSAAITGGTALPFGRDDAVRQARALEAVLESAHTGGPVDL